MRSDAKSLSIAETHVACDRLRGCLKLEGAHGMKCSVTKLAEDLERFAKTPVRLNTLESEVEYWTGRLFEALGRGEVRSMLSSLIISTKNESRRWVERDMKRQKKAKGHR